MNTPLTVFGLLAAVTTAAILYYNYKVLKAFWDDRDLAATKLVLKDGVPEAFRNLSAAATIFSAGSLVGAFALLEQNEALSYFSELGGITMIIGFVLFMRKISQVVHEEKERHTEQGKDEEE